MNTKLFQSTKYASYYMWVVTQVEDTIDLWHCAEDIACYFVKSNILTHRDLNYLRSIGKDKLEYIECIRNIAYRLYIYTNTGDRYKNWFDAEVLLMKNPWCEAVLDMASIIHSALETDEDMQRWSRYSFGN